MLVGHWAGRTRQVVAVGRNYAEHAKELGNAIPKKPLLFLKPPSSIIGPGQKIEIPRTVKSLHHEVELAVVIGREARNVSPQQALNYVAGYAVALDMTARDLQEEAKKSGAPWTEAKGYDTFLPLGEFKSKEQVGDPSDLGLWLKVDGQERQKGRTSAMIFSLPSLLSHISYIFTLQPGDIILTGTPSGVGEVKPGQTITAGIERVGEISFPVIDRLYPEPLSKL